MYFFLLKTFINEYQAALKDVNKKMAKKKNLLEF